MRASPTPAAHELRAHRGPEVDVHLVAPLAGDDVRSVRGPRDLLGHVAPDLEAARRRCKARSPRRARAAIGRREDARRPAGTTPATTPRQPAWMAATSPLASSATSTGTQSATRTPTAIASASARSPTSASASRPEGRRRLRRRRSRRRRAPASPARSPWPRGEREELRRRSRPARGTRGRKPALFEGRSSAGAPRRDDASKRLVIPLDAATHAPAGPVHRTRHPERTVPDPAEDRVGRDGRRLQGARARRQPHGRA